MPINVSKTEGGEIEQPNYAKSDADKYFVFTFRALMTLIGRLADKGILSREDVLAMAEEQRDELAKIAPGLDLSEVDEKLAQLRA